VGVARWRTPRAHTNVHHRCGPGPRLLSPIGPFLRGITCATAQCNVITSVA
jgi:hypothetical protein